MKTAEYARAHANVKRAYGPAYEWPCAFCGCGAEDWALNESCGTVKVDRNEMRHSDDVSDYRPLCKPCHKAEKRIYRRWGLSQYDQRCAELAAKRWAAEPGYKRDAFRMTQLAQITARLGSREKMHPVRVVRYTAAFGALMGQKTPEGAQRIREIIADMPQN